MNPDIILPWALSMTAHHNVRALCDLMGLSYEQKQVLTACVYIESGFHVNAEHQNFKFNADGSRTLESTDYGIVQVNDYWHIGPGKEFPNVAFVLANPEACVRWMCRYYKEHGNLNAWCSFTSGAYKRVLGTV